jgi:hypothetical protein
MLAEQSQVGFGFVYQGLQFSKLFVADELSWSRNLICACGSIQCVMLDNAKGCCPEIAGAEYVSQAPMF